MASKPMADGTEVIADVKIKMKKDKGTQNVKGCIINYKELKLKCNESCSRCKCSIEYPVMLILPVRISPEDTKEIEADLYNFHFDEKQTLKLYSPKEVKEPQQLNHQFLPCSLEAITKFESGIKRFIRPNAKKSSLEESQGYIREYRKSIEKVQPSELCKKGEQLFGIGKGNSDFRAKLVELKLCANGGELIKCDEDDSLDPNGVLLYGKKRRDKNTEKEDYYDVKVIGSYSEDNHGKITFKLIYELANNVPLNADFTSQSSAESDVQSTKPDTELENGLCEGAVAVILPENGAEAAVEKGHLGEDKVPEDCNNALIDGASTASNLAVSDGKETRPRKPSEFTYEDNPKVVGITCHEEEDTGGPYNSKEATREGIQKCIADQKPAARKNTGSENIDRSADEIFPATVVKPPTTQPECQRVKQPIQGFASGIAVDEQVRQLQEQRKNLEEVKAHGDVCLTQSPGPKGKSHVEKLQSYSGVLDEREKCLDKLDRRPFRNKSDHEMHLQNLDDLATAAVKKICESP